MNQAGAQVIRLAAPAKINLTLEVLNKRHDGYHGVRSVMVPLSFADELTLEPAEEATFSCSEPELETSDNLVVRTLSLLTVNARATLVKRIPVQAGLGGGSSDAAAVLRGAMAGAFGPLPVKDWNALARSLGSDVPFFLCGTAALVEGTGERVTPLGNLPAWAVIIVKPPVAVSTAQAYVALDRFPRPSRPRATSISLELAEALQRAQFSRVQELMHNDFHDVAIAAHPAIGLAAERLRACGAGNAMLCGSGSAVFSLFETEPHAREAMDRLHLPGEFAAVLTHFRQAGNWRAESQ